MEVWKDIAGYEGIYQVSDAGRVRSVDRVNSQGAKLKGKPRKLITDRDGYYVVGLTRNAVMRYHKVHRLVAAAFIPNPDNLPQVNHVEGNKSDNRACKLEWCTNQENIDHSVMVGSRDPVGESNGRARLSELDVVDIRWLKGLGMSISALAREYQVTRTNIRHIVTGRSWSHV
jgi:hypothetical protein